MYTHTFLHVYIYNQLYFPCLTTTSDCFRLQLWWKIRSRKWLALLPPPLGISSVHYCPGMHSALACTLNNKWSQEGRKRLRRKINGEADHAGGEVLGRLGEMENRLVVACRALLGRASSWLQRLVTWWEETAKSESITLHSCVFRTKNTITCVCLANWVSLTSKRLFSSPPQTPPPPLWEDESRNRCSSWEIRTAFPRAHWSCSVS